MSIIAHDLEALRPYYVMPYFPNGPLSKVCGRLHPTQFLTIARDLAEAIAAMHQQNIVHGDIKPDNILRSGPETVKLSDPLGNGGGCTLSFTANCGGTPGYAPSEVFAGQPISCPSDVFSFGATLFHMVTGIRPRDGQDYDTAKSAARVPESVQILILACTRAEPEKRPTIDTVLEYLRVRVTEADWAKVKPVSGPALSPAQALVVVLLVAAVAYFGYKLIQSFAK